MKKLINFLMSIVVDVRIRSFVVLLEDWDTGASLSDG